MRLIRAKALRGFKGVVPLCNNCLKEWPGGSARPSRAAAGACG